MISPPSGDSASLPPATGPAPPPSIAVIRRVRVALTQRPWLVLAALYFLLGAPFVGLYPLPSGDEIIGSDPAAEWILHGRIRSSVFGELSGFERCYFLQPAGELLSLAATYAIAGVSPISTRLQALAWAAIALAAWGALAAAWTGSRRAGLFAALLIACIPAFGHTVASARMDPQALALIAFSLLLWLPAPGIPARHPCTAGILLGLAGLTHPIIVFWALGLGAGALLGSPVRRRSLVWLVAGAFIPFAAWLAVGAAYPAEFARQFLGHGTGKLGGSDLLGLAFGELQRTVVGFAQQPLLPLLFALGAWAWWHRYRNATEFRRETSVLTLVVFGGVTFGLEKASGPHLVYHSVLLSVGAAAWLDHLLSAPVTASRWSHRLALGAIAIVLLIGASRWAVPRLVAVGPQRIARDHSAFAREIARLVPPGSNVAGEPVAYYAVRAAGGWLRLAVTPDPRRHHFVIFSVHSAWQLGPDFETIATVGHPLPPWHGRTFTAGEELHVVVARSRLLSPPAR